MKDQAQKWAMLVSSRKSKSKKGVINVYEFDEEQFQSQGYICKNFSSYDLEWLDFVVACRQGRDNTNYDIVEGGVANDQVIDTVEDYENGRLTAAQALDQLRYKKPNNQICIRNQEIIDRYVTFLIAEELK